MMPNRLPLQLLMITALLRNDHTPLDEAVEGQHSEIRDYLLDRGAKRGPHLNRGNGS